AEVAAAFAIVNGTISSINTVKGWIQELRTFQKQVHKAEQTLTQLMLAYLDSELALKLWAKIAEQTPINRLMVVTETAPDVLEKLKIIDTLMARVKVRSEEAFKHKHQRSMIPEQSKTILAEANRATFLKAMYNSRIPSKSLYNSCCDAREKFQSPNIQLEMDICQQELEPSGARPLYELQYALYFPAENRIREYVVAGPLSPDKDPGPDLGSLYAACAGEEGEADTMQYFKIGAVWFGSRRPGDPGGLIPHDAEDRQARLKPLGSILYDLRLKEPIDAFPLAERLQFAFKVAQWGFFLCGTSWMANLRLKNVRSIRDRAKTRHFLLQTQAPPVVIADTEDRKEQARLFAEHVFSIGILLLEAGIGRSLVKLDWDAENGYSFHLCPVRMSNAARNKPLTAAEASTELQRAVGDDYVKAVKSCLECENLMRTAQKAPADPRDLCVKMLNEYYTNVYLP
ncbi:hypothetical protein GQ53DRAFT_615945, partial [Thozetella sp. PMI_491]